MVVAWLIAVARWSWST